MISGKKLVVISSKHRLGRASQRHLAIRESSRTMAQALFDLNFTPPPEEEDDQNEDAGILIQAIHQDAWNLLQFDSRQ
jgi:hypothetical protein